MTRFSTFVVAIVILTTGVTVSLAQPRYGVSPFGGFFVPLDRSSGPIPRTVVSFQSNYAPGTVYIDTSERRLYLVIRPGLAIRYGIGVGRDGYGWSGVHRVSAKREWRLVSRIDTLSHSRLERARNNWAGRLFRLFSHDQR